MAESLKERQDNELEVIQAIFMDDFCDLRDQSTRDQDGPPEISLKLYPCESMRQNESHVSLDLLVKYPKKYPNRSPGLKLENAKGLSKDKVLELENEIQCMAANLVGEVMVLQLAQHVQNFLHQNNVPPPLSFYEEMMTKKKRDMERQKAAEKEKKEQERKANVIQIEEEEQQIREEMTRREEALRNLKKRSLKEKESLRVGKISPNVSNGTEKRTEAAVREKTKRKSMSEDVLPYDGMRVAVFQNKKQHIVHCGKCLGHGPSGSSVFCALDITTGEMVALSEWQFKGQLAAKRPLHDKTRVEDDKLSKQLSSIEQEIASLVTRVDHSNLVHYLGVTQAHESNVITLQVLTEFIAGGSLDKELRSGGIPLEILKDYAQQLLEVLAYLHGKSIVHKDIKLSSVFIDQEKTLRLADYSVGRRLCDLHQTFGERKLSKKTSAPDTRSSQKYTKKMDIVKLGLLMLSLLEGEVTGSVPPTIPQSFPAELKDFFTRCLYPDDGDQFSAHQLLNHPFIAPAPLHNSVLNNGAGDGDGADNAMDEQSLAQENFGSSVHLLSEIPFSCVNVVGKSRIKSDFEVLQLLGKGGFGSVVKVRNNLDGCLYAIKRIPLNPRSVQFNKRITREVKLLSRLNHENIVRYYNSWIEVGEEQESESAASEVKSSDVESKEKLPVEDSLMELNKIEAPSMCATAGDDDCSWGSEKINDEDRPRSFSSSDEELEDRVSKPAKSSLSSNPNESSEDIMFRRNIEDSFIQFGSSLACEEEESDYETEEEITSESTEDTKGGLQHLYIQMEFCENSTLRSVIDEGLYKDQKRIWRLLREIVEGLVHVHSQGMIHRDLKPVNIFLDSNDRVKIGDFGLATTHPFTKGGGGGQPEADIHKTSLDNTGTHESMTGKVGTALYVSPELENALSRIWYTQKVDLYSLGIIFFEMCYRPLETVMERVNVLGNLRTEKIILPKDFDMQGLEKQAHIIRWLLHHNPDVRPTSEELLKSQYIPPKIEDNALEEILNHTLATTNSTRYRTLVSFMMNQEVAQNKIDLTYDYELVTTQFSSKHAVTQQLVHDELVNIFRRHGFLMLDTPLLVPKTKVWKQAETSVTMMDHSGAILTLPYDLRTSFARYLARNDFPSLKRYSIGRVYHDTRILGVHPREHCECALDIATSSPSDHVPDAEILCVVGEIIEKFASLDSRNYYVRINHAVLTRSILSANGVPEEKIADVISLLQEARNEVGEVVLMKFLESLSLSDATVAKLWRWLLTETPIEAAKSALGHAFRGQSAVTHRVRTAIQDLEKIVEHAQRMGLRLQVVLYPGLVYNYQRMSGALFQFVAEKQKSKASGVDILAAGGRYDKLISVFSRGKELPAGYGAVGVSLNVERVIQAVAQDSECGDLQVGMCEVLVCAVGENPLLVERAEVVRRLTRSWRNISASLWYEPLSHSSLDEMQAHCRDCGIQYLVIMEENAPSRVRITEKEREFRGIDDPVEYLFNLTQKSQEPTDNSEREVPPHVGHKTSVTSSDSNSLPLPKFNICFVSQEKIEKNVKRRYESHMVSKVTQILQSLGVHKNPYLLIAVDLPVSVLRSISAMLDLSEENSSSKFSASVKMICEQLKQIRHRRHVPEVCDKILEEKANLAMSILFLYSYTDEQCVLMHV